MIERWPVLSEIVRGLSDVKKTTPREINAIDTTLQVELIVNLAEEGRTAES